MTALVGMNAGYQACHSCQKNTVPRSVGRGNADDKAGHRDGSIIRAKYGSAKPSDSACSVGLTVIVRHGLSLLLAQRFDG
jgi:hypothetical protein